MPGANSVTSNQEALHKDLEEVVRKYARTTFLRPIADHTREAFAEVEEFVRKFYAGNDAHGIAPQAVILDSGCGTGESTIHIARRFPGIPVIGIDKSCARLNKAGNPSQTAGEEVPANAFWIRAELLDFWRLALEHVKDGKWTLPESVAQAKRGHKTLPHAPDIPDAPCARRNNRTPYELGNLRPGICRSHKDCIRRTRDVCRRNRKR